MSEHDPIALSLSFNGQVRDLTVAPSATLVERGYPQTFAERTFSQLEGFGSYGFPESHAASFALIAYASSWMKWHHPEVFCAALLNAQPMGFYAPAQIVRDAIEHGVEVRPVCVNASRWDCTLEEAAAGHLAVRLGMRMVVGLSNTDAARIVAAREGIPFAGPDDVWRRLRVPVASLDRLAEADAFRAGLGLARREAMWAIKAVRDEPLPLFVAAEARKQAHIPEANEPATALKPMTAGREVVEDHRHLSLTLREHPISFLRAELTERGIVTCAEAMGSKDGRRLTTAGVVLVRQMPASAKGVMFITIEDETGAANLVVWPNLFEEQRRGVLGANMFGVPGRIQRESEVVHLIAQRLHDMSDALASVGDRDAPFPLRAGRGDEARHASAPDPRERAPVRPRDMYSPDLSLEAIRMKTRNFR